MNESIAKEIQAQTKQIKTIINKKLNEYLESISTFIYNLIENFCIRNQSQSDFQSIKKEKKSEGNLSSRIQIIKKIEDGTNLFSMCFLRDGRLVAGGKSRVVVYNKSTYESDMVIEEQNDIYSICVLRNGNLVYSTGRISKMKICEIDGNKHHLIHKINAHNMWINKIIELDDGKLCTCSDDRTIKIFDNDYKCIQVLEGHPSEVNSIIEMNNYIVSADKDTSVRIWDKAQYDCVKIINGISCFWINGSSKLNENTIIFGGWKQFFILDASSLQFKTFTDLEFGYIESVCVLKDGNVLLGNKGGNIMHFNVSSNQITSFTQKIHEENLVCIVESEDNKIISSSKVQTVVFMINSG